jgi:photosystem II stability/assembly factor-like uncharacterized protein
LTKSKQYSSMRIYSSISIALAVCSFFSTELKAQWESSGSGFTGIPGFPRAMFCVDMVDENVVWATPVSLQFQDVRDVIKTTDGGQTWIALELPETDGDHMPQRIFALNDQEAWVSVLRYPGQSQSRVFHTADGGATWEDQLGPFNNTNQGVENIHFFDNLEGIAFGSPNTGNAGNDVIKVYRTEDGGSLWTQVSNDDLPTPIADERYILFSGNDSYAASGDTVWFTTTANRVFRSIDRGATWQAFVTPLPGSNTTAGLASIAFKDHLNGMVVSFLPQQGAITTNGGATWTAITMPSAPQARNVQYVPGTDGTYILSDGFVETSALISYSLDGGITWGQLAGNPAMNCMDFISATSGWGGTNIPEDGEAMYKWTSDWLLNLSAASIEDADFQIYPNPVSDFLHIDLVSESTGITSWKILEITGRPIREGDAFAQTKLVLDVQGLSNGMYIIQMGGAEWNYSRKFIKQ